MKHLIILLFLFTQLPVQAQPGNFHPMLRIGWTSWEPDTVYYENGTIKKVSQSKTKKRYLGSTSHVSKFKSTEFDTNGRWYFKQKRRVDAGCFHYKNHIIWTKERNRSDSLSVI